MPALDTSYEPFSKQAEYLDLNRCFVRSVLARLDGARLLVDVACGAGTLTGLLAEELSRQAEPGGPLRLVGVDLSRRSLEIARQDLGAHGLLDGSSRRLRAVLVEGSGCALPLADGTADGLMIGNAFHLFPDKPVFVAEVRRVLREGAPFAFNTAFYEGGRCPESELFYETWLRHALRRVKQTPGARRARGTTPPATFSNPELTPPEYRALVEQGGFHVTAVVERTVAMSRRNLETIGGYREFAAAQLAGYDVDLACEALVASVPSSLEAAGLETVPRSWLELVAIRA